MPRRGKDAILMLPEMSGAVAQAKRPHPTSGETRTFRLPIGPTEKT